MSRARDLGSSINSAVSGKNFIINGGMDIAQRGVFLTGVQGYNLDRWLINGYGTSINYSVNQYLISGGIPGVRYYQRIASTTTSTQNFWLSQSLETNEAVRFAGQTVTLSFYYRMPTNNFTNAWTANTMYSTGTDANLHYPAASTYITAENLTNTTSWTRYTKTFNVPITATSFTFMLNTTNNVVNAALFDITGVQLEIGSSATPFSRAGGDIQGELAKCQRYYYKTPNSVMTAYSSYNSGNVVSTPMFYPSIMRIAPSISVADTAGTANRITIYPGGLSASPGITPAGTTIITNGYWNYLQGGSSSGNQGSSGVMGLTYEASAEL